MLVVYAPSGISGFLVSLAPSLGYIRPKENPGNLVSCEVLEFLVVLVSSFHFSQSSYICFTYSVQGF